MGALKQLRISFTLLVIFTVITGIIYPSIVTLIAQWSCPQKANGSLIVRNNEIIGSQLIGQAFTKPGYFWGRPSATIPQPYKANDSNASNSGPLNQDYLNTVQQRVTALRKANPQAQGLVPVDLVTASASGLDPDISPMAAYYQVPRIAAARQIPEVEVEMLVDRFIQRRTFGLIGEPRVNVLQLNLAMDVLQMLGKTNGKPAKS